MIAGWARDDDLPGPCRLQVRYRQMVVAETIADTFRADLLRAGHGHGHYGFGARLRHPLPPGPCEVLLHLPHAGVSAPMRVDMPALEPPRQVSVEALLGRQPGWTTSDLTAHPGCVDADATYARLGAERFVDAVFRFVFARWPSHAELRMNVDSLRAGRVSPRALLLECLCSRERADMDPSLPAPFEPDYPFLTTPAGVGR